MIDYVAIPDILNVGRSAGASFFGSLTNGAAVRYKGITPKWRNGSASDL